MNKIKVGVLGIGHLGKLHASLYKEIEAAELCGFYDIDESKSQKVSEELNIPAFKNRDELLEQADAINVVTPTLNHFESAKRALNHDCHLFIEKPIMATEEEAQQIIALANEKNKTLQVGHIERFNPAILALSDVQLKPLFIESHRLSSFNPRGTDVAVILDLMIHDLDLILSLVKSKPVTIDASGVGVVSKTIDIANARIKFENGCVANVTASRISAKKMRKMRIFQENSYISIDFVEGFSEMYYIPTSESQSFKDGTLAFSLGQIEAGADKKEIKYNKLQRVGVNSLKQELSTFLNSIQANIPPIVSGEEGLAALQLAIQVLKEIGDHTNSIKERTNN